MSDAPLSVAVAEGFDRDATIEMVGQYLSHLRLDLDARQVAGLAEHLTDMVFGEASKDMYALTEAMKGLTEKLTEVHHRLQDAETTIAKIRFNDSVAMDALERYEKKYGTLRDIEHRVVK